MQYITKRDSNGNVVSTHPPMISGTVVDIERHGHTIYGNPMISIKVDGIDFAGKPIHYWYRISNNASLAYEIENPEFWNEPHTFYLTRAGRISNRAR